MIFEAEIERALSQHLARTVTNMQHGQNAMAVDGVDHGIDLEAAACVGRRYYEYLTRSGRLELGAEEAAAMAFAAGALVGRTAKEADL